MIQLASVARLNGTPSDDVGTDDALDVHHALGGEDVLRTVDVGSKLAALLRELADAREGEDLEAAGVGEDRACGWWRQRLLAFLPRTLQ